MRARRCGWEINARLVVRYHYAYEFENHIDPLRPFSLLSSRSTGKAFTCLTRRQQQLIYIACGRHQLSLILPLSVFTQASTAIQMTHNSRDDYATTPNHDTLATYSTMSQATENAMQTAINIVSYRIVTDAGSY